MKILKIIFVCLSVLSIAIFASDYKGARTAYSCVFATSLANINPDANIDSDTCTWDLPSPECYPAPCGFFQGNNCYSCKGIGLVKRELRCKHITSQQWMDKMAPECKDFLNDTK